MDLCVCVSPVSLMFHPRENFDVNLNQCFGMSVFTWVSYQLLVKCCTTWRVLPLVLILMQREFPTPYDHPLFLFSGAEETLYDIFLRYVVSVNYID